MSEFLSEDGFFFDELRDIYALTFGEKREVSIYFDSCVVKDCWLKFKRNGVKVVDMERRDLPESIVVKLKHLEDA